LPLPLLLTQSLAADLMTETTANRGRPRRYSSEFCRRIGAVSFTPQARGTITLVWGTASDFAEILWDFSGPDKEPAEVAPEHLSALERCR
jgi:hypothetical protein